MSWRNNIRLSLGLISLVVGLDTAIGKESDDTSNHLACGGAPGKPHALTRTKAPTVCPVCENADRSTFVSVRETPEGLKPVSDEDKAEAHALIKDMKKEIVLGLHDASEVSLKTLPSGSGYYLTPQAGADVYAALVDLLRRHPDKVLLGQWVPSSRANVYQFKVFGDTLVMVQVARTENVKVVQQPAMEAKPEHTAMIDAFLDSLTTPYDPATYADQYLARMRELLASRETVEVEGIKASKGGKDVAPVVDLTTALAKMAEQQAAAKKKPARKRAERKSA